MRWHFDSSLFARMMLAKMEANSLSLRAVADFTGIATATIMRMSKGKKADIDSILQVCRWLGLLVDFFVIKKSDD